MTYEEKILKALDLSTTIDDVLYIEDKILHTDQINRRTNAGRELTDKLLKLMMDKYTYLKDIKGCLPF
jgi:hypothetical protein